MRALQLCLLVVLGFFPAVFALHESEAGVVDWHKPLIGVPLTYSHSLSPTLHRFSAGRLRKSTQSIILTATEANVLAAVNPVDGELVWRFAFEPEDPIVSYRAHGDVVCVLSGPGGSTFRTFETANGNLIAERRLHKPSFGRLFEPVDLGVHMSFVDSNFTNLSPTTDLFVLTDGYTVRRLDSGSGRIKWEWSAEDQGSLVVYSRIARTSSAVYVIGLAKSFASYTLHVHALSPSTGEVISNAHIPSSIYNGLTDFLLISDATKEDDTPHIVWLEKGSMRHIMLTPQLNEKSLVIKGVTYKSILNIGLNERGYFVALKDDGAARVMRIDAEGTRVNPAFEFPESESSDRYSDSLYAGGLDKDGIPHIGRVYWTHVFQTAGAQIFSPLSAHGKGMITGFTFPFATNLHGIIHHIAFDAAQPAETVVLGRFVLTTGTGAVQLWQQDKVQWTREESLSEIKVTEMIELPEKKTVTSHINVENETMSARLSRQLLDMKFPSYLISFVKRFATGSYASVSTSAAAEGDSAESLFRDEFGFRKVIVAATGRGNVFGIDSGNGAILWSRILGLGVAAERGGHHVPFKMFVTKTVSDGETPRVALVTQRLSKSGLVDAVVFNLDALTGEDVLGKSSTHDVLNGEEVVPGEILDVFMLENDRTIVLVDKYLQIHLYPDNKETRTTFESLASKLHFPLKATDRILGHQISPKPRAISGKFNAYSTWTMALPAGEEILSQFSPPSEPIASFGKVLGDRRTLYKYLNPAITGLITTSRGTEQPTCGLYVVDGGKGTVLYHAVLPSVNGACNIKAAMAENWLVYIYYDDEISSAVQAKGYRAVSVEFYEGKQINDKTRSSEASIYSNTSANVQIYQQGFVFPYEVTTMTTSKTKFGIATKDLIVANRRGQIQTLPRRIFDPRRPKGKPTTEEQEEMLFQYDPLIPDDSRRVISHNYKFARIDRIITSPAVLESTSLVFAYGLDLFSSRIAPSKTFDVLNENFNKAQLVLTIGGLAAAIMIARPRVKRKRLMERWYHSQ
ncbi:DUF1620-domain-containing protein [Schizopora paradoxa]|uniref:ER membrane protein complex subunit 1 n=1 Tax=Schizopora paradoxa TaxID=27342 RepID=A0A0H2SNT3_9AGAM|nr:DUF1620-domain-containing protein [Schizopora paradoxa]